MSNRTIVEDSHTRNFAVSCRVCQQVLLIAGDHVRVNCEVHAVCDSPSLVIVSTGACACGRLIELSHLSPPDTVADVRLWDDRVAPASKQWAIWPEELEMLIESRSYLSFLIEQIETSVGIPLTLSGNWLLFR
jgi:hypothetical protein